MRAAGPAKLNTSTSMSRAPRSAAASQRRVRATAFAALGDPTRLALVARLTQHSKLTRQAITKHLRALEQARIVRGTRSGRESRFVSEQWDDALARLRTLVEG